MERNGRNTPGGAIPPSGEGGGKRITHDRKAMQKLMLFGVLLVVSLVMIFQFIVSRPPLSDECSHIGLSTLVRGGMPTFLGGDGDPLGTTKVLWKCAEEYRKDHPGSVLGIYIVCYIALQAFAIPGPLLLSILAGAMYPLLFAQLLILICSTTGSVLAYLLSRTLGEELLQWCWPTMIDRFRQKVQENKDNLFYYMLFLRLTPIMPNWFVNIACPIVGVPLSCFIGATALGKSQSIFIICETC
eukprot:gb/GECG01008651.1/.p1 GENE.gb/GECG01008651.1/~~gb/GECG01008651.1/.p1  ORF type:complete len:243 (+),score=10.10 gb/GECG01008651.1/:1-729(+)